MDRPRFLFPEWTNLILPSVIFVMLTAPPYIIYMVAWGASPQTTDVGYMPEQPIPFSHRVHAGELGIDCRYCHNTVEHASHAAIPPTQTCMNCHASIRPESDKLKPLYESYELGTPINWIKIHDLPDHAYFNHAAHVNRGVSCVECHGRIDTMDVVYQHEPLSMGWCLSCHRNPEPKLRDPSLVTQLDWGVERSDKEKLEQGIYWRKHNNLNPSQECSACHR